jgi:hypothetical protein
MIFLHRNLFHLTYITLLDVIVIITSVNVSRVVKIEQIDVSELRVALNYLIEFVGCKCFLGKDEFLIFVVYFPRTPSLPKLTTFCNYFEHNFVSTNNIIGDFNIPQFIQKDNYN